jgi:4-hydroxy-tetrahydrodipicolinate synthase
MIACANDGALEEAAHIHMQLAPLVAALFVTTSPIPLKYALARCGFPCGGLRLPLIEIDDRSAAAVDAALARIEVDLPALAPAR